MDILHRITNRNNYYNVIVFLKFSFLCFEHNIDSIKSNKIYLFKKYMCTICNGTGNLIVKIINNLFNFFFTLRT